MSASLTLSACRLLALAQLGGIRACRRSFVDGFAAGLAHPFTGLDHLLAMVAVGLWASQLGGRAMLLLPALFPVVMVAGAIMGGHGVTLPGVEAAIVTSVVVLGVAVALGWQVSILVSAALIGIFAVSHGYAHGAEFAGGGRAFSMAPVLCSRRLRCMRSGLAWRAGEAVRS